MGIYYPFRSKKFDDFSRLILDFKEGKEHSVNYFYSLAVNLLNQILPDNENFKIGTIPRSTPGVQKDGFYFLYHLLKKYYRSQLINYGDVNILKRGIAISKQTSILGRMRNIEWL